MGSQGLLRLIELKILIIMTSLQNIVITGAQLQGLLMLMGSKFLIKMIRPQNIKMKEQCFVAWSSLSKILSHQHQETLSTEITKFCSEVMMIKIFKQEALAAHFDFISFSTRLFSSWPLLFYTWGVLV